MNKLFLVIVCLSIILFACNKNDGGAKGVTVTTPVVKNVDSVWVSEFNTYLAEGQQYAKFSIGMKLRGEVFPREILFDEGKMEVCSDDEGKNLHHTLTTISPSSLNVVVLEDKVIKILAAFDTSKIAGKVLISKNILYQAY